MTKKQLGFANPSLSSQHIKAQKLAVAEQRTHLQDLRQQRSALHESRIAAAEDVRRAEAVLRDAHHARLQQRQQLLEQQAVKVCELVELLLQWLFLCQAVPHANFALVVSVCMFMCMCLLRRVTMHAGK